MFLILWQFKFLCFLDRVIVLWWINAHFGYFTGFSPIFLSIFNSTISNFSEIYCLIWLWIFRWSDISALRIFSFFGSVARIIISFSYLIGVVILWSWTFPRDVIIPFLETWIKSNTLRSWIIIQSCAWLSSIKFTLWYCIRITLCFLVMIAITISRF